MIVCALSLTRMAVLFQLVGMAPLSSTDHYGFKEEIEPILANAAETSMCAAHVRNVKAGNTDYVSIDGGFTAPRNAHGCTMCAHAADGGIVECIHKRLTDEGATSSKSLELLCFQELLTKMRMLIYTTVVMDGCRDFVTYCLAAGLRVQGDMWHVGKNWYKWAEHAITTLCRRPQKTGADAADNPSVAAVTVPADKIEKYGTKPANVPAIEFAQQRVREMGGVPQVDATLYDLKKIFGQLAREKALTPEQRVQEKRRAAYLAEKKRREAASKGREVLRGTVAVAQLQAMAWRRDLRSMQRYIAEYTRPLRSTLDDEARAVEFKRLWREGCIALVLGQTDNAVLKLLSHPVTDTERTEPWVPPGQGYVSRDSFAFSVLDSIICDPVWDSKFPALIDGRMTFHNESFFHTLRKWGSKHYHYHRFYSLAIWCALLSWNENVNRVTLEKVWKRKKSGQLSSSSGRKYCVAIRVPMTNLWMEDVWARYIARYNEVPLEGDVEPLPGYHLPARTRMAPCEKDIGAPLAVPTSPTRAQFVAPPERPEVTTMKVDELKAELSAAGLPATGLKPVLVAAVIAARANPSAAQAAAAPQIARTEIPVPSPRRTTRVHTFIGGTKLPFGGTLPKKVDSLVVVQPDAKLPGPYLLQSSQRQKRKAPPTGQKKWTMSNIKKAMTDIAAGKDPTPLRKKVTDADVRMSERSAVSAEEAEILAQQNEDAEVVAYGAPLRQAASSGDEDGDDFAIQTMPMDADMQ